MGIGSGPAIQGDILSPVAAGIEVTWQDGHCHYPRRQILPGGGSHHQARLRQNCLRRTSHSAIPRTGASTELKMADQRGDLGNSRGLLVPSFVTEQVHRVSVAVSIAIAIGVAVAI